MRTFMVLSAVLSGFSVLLLAFTRDWTLVIPLNIMLNVSLCLFMPARMAIVAENTTPTNRASLFGIMNLAWPIAGIVGPLAGGYLIEHVGWGNVFIIADSISFIALFPANKIQQKKVEPNKSEAKKSNRQSIFDRRFTPIMAILFGLQVLVTTCMAGVNMILPIYLQDRYHLSYALIGAFFTGSNILLILTQIGGGIIADRYGRGRLILICTVLAPLTLGTWIFFDNWIILFAIYALAFAFWSLTWPPMLALLTELLPRELHGAGFGLNMTASRLGFTIGPIIAGFFYMMPGSITPFIVSTLIYSLAIPFAYILKRKEKESSI